MDGRIGIVDLFSGPGGLGEGLASVRDARSRPVFGIDVSIEADAVAHRTLRLRSFLRKVPGGFPQEYYDWINGLTGEPDWAALRPAEWAASGAECRHLELGTEMARSFLERRIPEIRRRRGDATVLIGGPPCQAYSLAGRARASSKGYAPHPKDRHLLYREYIEVLRQLRPAAFVMENVKGLLSSQTEDARIVEEVLADLRGGGGAGAYRVFPIAAEDPQAQRDPRPIDFVVRAERHGVPQTRHRVIIMGIREDLAARLPDGALPRLRVREGQVGVLDAIGDLPRLRSLLSYRTGEKDSSDAWCRTVKAAASRVRRYAGRRLPASQREVFLGVLAGLTTTSSDPAAGTPEGRWRGGMAEGCPQDLAFWLSDPKVTSPSHHVARAHMTADLERYVFASAWALATGETPRSRHFPNFLAPDHGSWGKGFNDRFRVQIGHRASSTVTCHVSKDGHYFIHPDPTQVRTLTVREVARLQTFPDNYHFAGNRTQAYVQVGNAVPPFLARQIGEALALALVGALSSQNLEMAEPFRVAV